jgi:cobalt-zinc-cadmium efflux system outer membrane protein
VKGFPANAWMAFLLLAVLPGCRAPQSANPTLSCSPSLPPVEARNVSDSLVLTAGSDAAEYHTRFEVPEDDETPSEGLTLDAAIDRLLAANLDLAAKFQDIPKARADILSARLRNDPVLFLSATQLPYQQYSAQRPGTPLYDITLVQPLDVSGKHRTSIRVAEQEYRVLEARYQDAVRHEIDKLYNAYIDVLEARALRKTAQAEVDVLTELVETARRLVQKGGQRPQRDLTAAKVRKYMAEIVLQRADLSLQRTRRNLAVLLAAPEQAGSLKLQGSLHDRAPPPPCIEELIRMALESRPDLLSYRLSVERAQAQVRQQRAQGIDDVFLFFSPYQAMDNSAQGKQTANGWEMGVLVPFPALNRNQGNVARAQANVTQLAIEVESVVQQVISEIRRAVSEYEVSRDEVERFERDLLPGVRSVRADKSRLYATGQQSIEAVLTAQRDYNDTVRQYWEALTRHRRSMLELNSAVGRRLLP